MLKPDSITRTCLETPGQADSYRRLAGQGHENANRLSRLGRWLCVLGASRSAIAVFRLMSRGTTNGNVGAEDIRKLAMTLSRSRYLGAGSGRTTKMLSVFWSNQPDPAARVALIDLLIWRTSLDLTEASVDRLLGIIRPEDLTPHQLLTTARMAIKAGSADSIKLTQALLESQTYAPTNDDYRLARRRVLLSLHFWAIFRAQGPCAVLEYGAQSDDPLVREIFHEGFESLCYFSIGDIERALRTRSGLDLSHGLIFNGISLYPDSIEIGPALNSIRIEEAGSDAPDRFSKICVVLSCDTEYLEKYGLFFLEKFKPPTGLQWDLVFFVVGAPDDKLLQKMKSIYPDRVNLVIDPPEPVDRAYHTINRFVRVPHILSAYDLVVVSDIDARLDLSRTEFLEAVEGASAGWVAHANAIPWLRNLAGFVFFVRNSDGLWIAHAVAEIIRSIYRPKRSNANWFIDQVALAAILDYAPKNISDSIRFIDLEDANTFFKTVKLNSYSP